VQAAGSGIDSSDAAARVLFGGGNVDGQRQRLVALLGGDVFVDTDADDQHGAPAPSAPSATSSLDIANDLHDVLAVLHSAQMRCILAHAPRLDLQLFNAFPSDGPALTADRSARATRKTGQQPRKQAGSQQRGRRSSQVEEAKAASSAPAAQEPPLLAPCCSAQRFLRDINKLLTRLDLALNLQVDAGSRGRSDNRARPEQKRSRSTNRSQTREASDHLPAAVPQEDAVLDQTAATEARLRCVVQATFELHHSWAPQVGNAVGAAAAQSASRGSSSGVLASLQTTSSSPVAVVVNALVTFLRAVYRQLLQADDIKSGASSGAAASVQLQQQQLQQVCACMACSCVLMCVVRGTAVTHRHTWRQQLTVSQASVCVCTSAPHC
jgi:hypothetical protein